MSALLEATSVTVRAAAKSRIADINVAFDGGQVVALVGPNGAGKSTLLRVLSGEIKPHPGSIRLRGEQLASYSPQVLATHRAVLSQQVNIAFPFSVHDVVRMGLPDRRDRKIEDLVAATLAELDLYDLADRVITTLSGGEQQRVHFARVLAQLAYGRDQDGAGVLLLDEPTSSLDLHHQLRTFEAIARRVAQGALVIAVLHDINLAAQFAQRIIVMSRGRIDCDGRPEETVTTETLNRVFDIQAPVNRAPESGKPFILPHQMAALKTQSER